MVGCACYVGVKKKVAKVLSALDGWSNVVYDRVMFPAAVSGPRAQYFYNSCRLFVRSKCIMRDLYKYNKWIFTFEIIMPPFLQDHDHANS